jgi:mitochondrial import inner membrane translocase subunit TIM16
MQVIVGDGGGAATRDGVVHQV